MITIKESNIRYKHHAQQSLRRIDALGNKGYDLLDEHDIEFVVDGEADYGISWHGEYIPDVPLNKTILYKAEPPIYNLYFGRHLMDDNFMRQYMAVISDYILGDFPVVHCNLSLEFDFIPKYFYQKKTEFICMVLKNKRFGISLNSLYPRFRQYKKYSLMDYRKAMDTFLCDTFGPLKYHSYGRGWKKKCFHGELPRWGNLEVFSKHKFTLSLENSCIRGYATEKLLYPMFCGSIPVYRGAPDVEKYAPKGTFIDLRDIDIRKELPAILENMDDKEYKKYLSRIRKYITRDESKAFSSVTFAKKIIEIIEGGKNEKPKGGKGT